jgi:hypothetical protein
VGESTDAYRVLVGKTERIKLLGRSTFRWENNIKRDLQEIEWEGVNRINLAQDGG